MKKNIILLTLLTITSFATAQTQQGYVKTIGRPGKPGNPLSQVTIRIKGETNSLISDEKGQFCFDIRRSTDSNAFYISSARKKGYVIADNDLATRPNPYSTTIPTIVVMVSQEELAADKRAIEEKTRQAVQAKYNQRVEELERQLKDATISEERYKNELAALMDWYDNIDNLVEKMAEYYSRVDYDQLSKEDAAINLYIEQGQLDRADSLIDARGKIGDRIIAAKSQIEQGQKLQTSGATIEQDGLAQLRSAQQDAEHKYNIAMAHFDNATALEMLQQLVESDSTNYEYLLNLADFYRKTIIDYQKAEKIYLRAYAQACALNDTISPSIVLNNYGILLSDMERREEAFECYKRALDTRLAYSDEITEGLIKCYINIIAHYEDIEKYTQAQEKIKEVEDLIEASGLKDDPEITGTIIVLKSHKASCYAFLGNITKAEELMIETLNMCMEQCGHYKEDTFSAYNSLGWLYDKTGRSEEAINMYNQCIDIAQKLYGDSHTAVATAYSNISAAYQSCDQSDKALEYAEKALDMRRKLLGNMHPDVATTLHNIGNIFIENKACDAAIPYLAEAAKIHEARLPKFDSSAANTYHHLAMAYCSSATPDYQKAIEYDRKAVEIYSEIDGNEFDYFLAAVALAQNLEKTQDYESAINILRDICQKDPDWLGKHSHYHFAAYIMLQNIYHDLGDLHHALEMAIGGFRQQIFADGFDTQIATKIYYNIYDFVQKLKASEKYTAETHKMLSEFLSTISIQVTIGSKETAAGQLGWTDTYDLMHYNDWDFTAEPMEFYNYMDSQIDKPKSVIVLRDRQFLTHTFEDKIGAKMTVRLISQEERAAITKLYNKNRKKLLKEFRK